MKARGFALSFIASGSFAVAAALAVDSVRLGLVVFLALIGCVMFAELAVYMESGGGDES